MQRIKNTDKDAKTKTKIVIGTPKSKKSIRILPIPDFLLEYLLYDLSKSNAYILTNSIIDFIEPRRYQNLFKKVLEDCNIINNKFHALRHTFATNMIKAGTDIKTVSEFLGHNSVQITLDLYVHSDFEEKRKAIQNVFYNGQNMGHNYRKVV